MLPSIKLGAKAVAVVLPSHSKSFADPLMNLPNSITVARLFLAAIFVAAASLGSQLGHLIALIAFSLAAISDFLDGYLARKLNLVT